MPLPTGRRFSWAIFWRPATGPRSISEIRPEDTVLIIGAGPTGLCTLQCVLLKKPKCVIICEKDAQRLQFVREHYPQVLAAAPEHIAGTVLRHSAHGGADVVLEVGGTEETFSMAWQCARPNAIVTIVALYDRAQVLPLPEMYGKNLIFKTGGVDGCNCAETLSSDRSGKIGHHAADHAYLSSIANRSRLRPVRTAARRCG